MKSSAKAELFFGRRQELARLRAAIRDRRSLLIFGPPDSGKSALVDRVLAKLPRDVACRCLRVNAQGRLQQVLREHVTELFSAEDPVVQAAFSAQPAGSGAVESWVKKQTSGGLRRLIFRAFDNGRYWIFWDNISQLSLAHYHFLREVTWMRKTPAYLLARGSGYEHLGPADTLFWSDEWRLKLGPLPPHEARALLEAALRREAVAHLDLAKFREQVFEAARGLPGAIVKMAAMAGQPRYRYGNRVKAKLIYMDYLVELVSRVQV